MHYSAPTDHPEAPAGTASDPSDAEGRRGVPSGARGLPRYRFGFLARYLRPLVFEARVSRSCRQYEVAQWLGIPSHALSEYLTRRSHPSSEREQKLLRLGCDVRRLRRAMLADKLGFWMDKMELSIDDLGGALRRVDAEVSQASDKNPN